MRARATVVAVLAAAAVLPGCGGEGADEALSETAAKLREIRSGELDLGLAIRGRGGSGAGDVGFRLEGPFALPRRRGQLPAARVDYTQLAGARRATVGLVSNGRAAFVVVDGTPYRLPDDQADRLRLGGAQRELDVEGWFRDARLEDGGRAGGAEVDRITARLNLAEAVNGLIGVAERAGAARAAGLRRIGRDDARELERAVRRNRVEILTGKDDRLLRRLELDVSFALDEAGADARQALGGLDGVRITLDVELDDPNRPVRVAAPRGARPYSELPRGG